jgi:succinate-semialdehyde dehydrogenase/glutarate-semialdehyde dehydrogenase
LFWYAENGPDFLRDEGILTDATRSYVRYAPLGSILAIMPWNFPFWQVFRCAVPTLLAGNCVILKHASNVQQCAALMEDIFLQAGCSEGVFKNIPAGSAKVPGLIAAPCVKAVTLTGSEEAGSDVAALAGRQLKKTVLELGGSNPFLVLDDADLSSAVETGFRSRMQNAGQSCIAAKRFIVHEKVYDAFVERFLQKAQKIIVSDPMNPVRKWNAGRDSACC